MIGLAGWVADPAAPAPPGVLERMLASLRHRGETVRTVLGPGFALGVVGGEGETLPELERGVSVLACEGWMISPSPGNLEAALEQGRGEFAAVSWDPARRRLLLARDPLGVRTLYFATIPGGLVFASEIKAVLAHPLVQPALDPACVAELLAYRYVAGGRTALCGVRAVQPGHRVLCAEGRVTETPYWELPYSRHDVVDGGDVGLRAEAALRRAVQEAGDLSPRTGVLLSGGLDSSLVTAMFAAQRREQPVLTWSAGSPDPRLDESERAAAVARALGTVHANRPVQGTEYAAALPEAILHNDAPLHHPNGVALLLVAREAARKVDALLMGEGADSSFGNRAALKLSLAGMLRRGGPLARAVLAALRSAGVPRAGALADLMAAPPDDFALASNQFTPAALATELSGGTRAEAVLGERRSMIEEGRGLDPVARLLRYYQKTELLASFDVFGKMLAAAGVEPRMPFGSRPLQEITCAMPSAQKVSLRGTAKPVLVSIARRHLPREVVRWPKMSFGYPMAAWMRRGGPLASFVRLLEGRDARVRGMLDPGVLARVISENEEGRGNHGEGALFVAINLEIWARVRLEGQPPAELLGEAAQLARA